MAEAMHQLGGGRAGDGGERGGAPTKVVEVQAAQPERADCGPPDRAAEVGVAQPAASWADEHEPCRLRCAKLATCSRRSPAITSGIAMVRRPATDFGGPTWRTPRVSSEADAATETVLWSRSSRPTVSAASSPNRSPQNAARVCWPARAVHDRWQAATDAGSDALMMARARTDVDALNHRARAAALVARDVRGPVLAHAGGRDWQAGDILRARRNDRRLHLGDGHVRNGDRFRVLRPGPDDGLIVEHLAGRGRAALPASYLTQHADYGWASTIDGAQGATADIGILLARTGLDREHLYVGMTRGREANHVHLTNQPADDELEHRQQPADPTPTIDDAVRFLRTATARVGAQQAAHTLLDQARDRAQGIGHRWQTGAATQQRNLARGQDSWAAPREKSRSWSPRPEIPSPSSGRSIGR